MRSISLFVVSFLLGFGLFAYTQSSETPQPNATAGAASATTKPPEGAVTPEKPEGAKTEALIKKTDSEVIGEEEVYEITRDPFVNPLGRTETGGELRPEGSKGYMISEMALWGVVDFEGKKIAILKGPDERGYFLTEGDTLWDGKVLSIDLDDGSVVFEKRESGDKTTLEQAVDVKKSLH